MDKPTLGRIVIYKYGEHEKCQHTNGSAECPAVIVRVWSDTTVNLKLIEDGPHDNWKTSATKGEAGGQWNWPNRLPATLTESSK